MDVLILHPSTFRKHYAKYAKAGSKTQPLGITYIAAMLEQNNISVEILDADILNLDFNQTLSKIKKINPKILLMSIVTVTYDSCAKIASAIKQSCPNISIVIGGPHIAFYSEETMINKDFDVGVIGEAELTSLELIKKILIKKSFKKVKGIIYNEKGIIKKTEKRKLISDLNKLPMPAYHLLPNLNLYHPQIHSFKYTPVANMVTSRGCPYRCTFCDKGIFGNKFRAINAINVVNQMQILKNKFGVKEITFYDDVFTLDKKRVYEICEEINSRNLKISWSCSSRADLLDKNLLIAMKKAGCWMIGMGIESGNQKVLNFIKKDINLNIIKKNIELANKVGIKVRAFFQIGHPTETKQSMKDTLNFAKSLKIYAADFLISTPFKGTEFYNNANKYGSVNLDDKTLFSKMYPIFVAKGLSKKYLYKKQKEFHQKFYLRPKIIFQYLKMIKNINDFKRYVSGFKILFQ